MPHGSGLLMAARIYDRTSQQQTNLWYPESGIVLTSIDVEMVQGGNHKISVQVEVPYKRALELFDNSYLFAISNVLMVRLGYSASGWLSPWFAGLTTEPSVSWGDTVSIGLEAVGAGALALARSHAKVWRGTRYSIVQEIANRFHWEIEFQGIPQGQGVAGLWGDTAYLFVEQQVEIAQAGETFFLFLASILYDVGYTFWIGTNSNGKATLFIRDRANSINEQPTRTLIKYGQLDRTKNQYPLLSYSTSSKAFMTTGDAGVTHAWMDEDGNIVSYQASEANGPSQKQGEGSGQPGKTDQVHEESGLQVDSTLQEGETGGVISVPSTTAGSSTQAIQSNHDGILAITKQATLETIGIPTLIPGELVAVVGCSRMYDGNHRIQSVKHSINGDSFRTTLEGVRDAYPKGYGYGDVYVSNTTPAAEGTD
jgi:hypothetical protein